MLRRGNEFAKLIYKKLPDKHILPDLFKELKDLTIFKELLPNFVYNHFQGKDCSLYDIIVYDSHLFSQSQSIGQGKIMKFKEFQGQFTDEKDVIVDYLGLYLYTAMVTQNSSQTVV
jgi:hypothetical protein